MEDARSTLHEAVVQAGMTVLGAMLEEDRAKLCGRRYEHNADRTATRAGFATGQLRMGGRRVSVERPRVRSNREDLAANVGTLRGRGSADATSRRTNGARRIDEKLRAVGRTGARSRSVERHEQ
jgi:hypothetical protein